MDDIFGSGGGGPERPSRSFDAARSQLMADFNAIVRDAEALLRAAAETSRRYPLRTLSGAAATGAAIGFIIARITRRD